MDEELRLRTETEGPGKTSKKEDGMQKTNPFLEGKKENIQSLKTKKEGMKKFRVSYQEKKQSLVNSPKNMTRLREGIHQMKSLEDCLGRKK